jgi:DNA modification methylase
MHTGRNFVGIEMDAGYFAIAEERIRKAAQMADGQFVTKAGKHTDLDALPMFAGVG